MSPTPRPDDVAWALRSAVGTGVYVHVPFCAHRCGYCDFAAFSDLDDLMPAYVTRLEAEAAARLHGPAASVFVGGGTPSRLPPELLARVLAAVPKADGAECTVEMNPESATDDVLASAVAGGATRVSFGMQSAVSHVLEFLERRHTPDAVPAAVAAARSAGVAEVNIDVIYGTPGESDADWDATLDAVLDCDPDHVSAYALGVEAATPLGRAVAAGERPAPDDDEQARRLAHTVDRLADAGLVRYEISNWARRRPSVHNLRYWSGGAYAGIGNGAHSWDPVAGVRSWNHRHPRTWVDADGPVADREVLTDDERDVETLLLGLRRVCGVALDDPATVPVDLVDGGLVRHDAGDGRLRCTTAGLAVHSAVVLALLDAGVRARSDVAGRPGGTAGGDGRGEGRGDGPVLSSGHDAE